MSDITEDTPLFRLEEKTANGNWIEAISMPLTEENLTTLMPALKSWYEPVTQFRAINIDNEAEIKTLGNGEKKPIEPFARPQHPSVLEDRLNGSDWKQTITVAFGRKHLRQAVRLLKEIYGPDFEFRARHFNSIDSIMPLGFGTVDGK